MNVKLLMRWALPITMFLLGWTQRSPAQCNDDYVLNRGVIASGGASNLAAGDYRLGGTIGQYDADVLVGGEFLLFGGFWSPATGVVTANPAATAPPPHDRPKNRYISFAPNNVGPVAFKVRRISPGPVMDVGWVGVPDGDGLAKIELAAVTRFWCEPTVHAGDCEIIPVAEYEVLATTDGVTFAPPLLVPTIDLPSGGKFWGDTVGSFDGVQWTAPNNVVNTNDFLAALQKFQNLPSAPHVTVVDVQSVSSTDPCLNRITNIADVFILIQAFQGNMYPFTTNPASCPACP